MHKYIVCLLLITSPLKACYFELESKLTKEEKASIRRIKFERAKHLLVTNQTNEIPAIFYTSDENIALTRQFLERGADPNLLSSTANKLCVETTRLLLEFNADPNYQVPHTKETALHELACTYNKRPNDVEKKITIAKLLLHHQAQLHLKDQEGETPLDKALWCYHDSGGSAYLGFKALAKLLGSESRYRLVLQLECARKKNPLSPFNLLPQDMINEIVLWVYPKLPIKK